MEPLIFRPELDTPGEHCGVLPIPDYEPSDALWEELSENTGRETNLIAYSPSVLRERWARGNAAIAVHEGCIISYTSLVPIYHESTRKRLAARLELHHLLEHTATMIEFATGWTHPAWRRKGLSLKLRRILLGHFDVSGVLFIGLTVTLGASPILARLGWQITAWNRIPFVASIIGVPIIGLEHCLGERGWLHPPHIHQYQGPHICPNNSGGHPWDQFCHLWISNTELATNMDRHLSELLGGDLRRWREVIVGEFTVCPEALWKVNLFQEQCL